MKIIPVTIAVSALFISNTLLCAGTIRLKNGKVIPKAEIETIEDGVVTLEIKGAEPMKVKVEDIQMYSAKELKDLVEDDRNEIADYKITFLEHGIPAAGKIMKKRAVLRKTTSTRYNNNNNYNNNNYHRNDETTSLATENERNSEQESKDMKVRCAVRRISDSKTNAMPSQVRMPVIVTYYALLEDGVVSRYIATNYTPMLKVTNNIEREEVLKSARRPIIDLLEKAEDKIGDKSNYEYKIKLQRPKKEDAQILMIRTEVWGNDPKEPLQIKEQSVYPYNLEKEWWKNAKTR